MLSIYTKLALYHSNACFNISNGYHAHGDEQICRGLSSEQLSIKESQVSLESDFSRNLNAESLDIVECVMALE